MPRIRNAVLIEQIQADAKRLGLEPSRYVWSVGEREQEFTNDTGVIGTYMTLKLKRSPKNENVGFSIDDILFKADTGEILQRGHFREL